MGKIKMANMFPDIGDVTVMPLLMMLLLLMLMLMLMPMMLALTLLVLPDAFEAAAYVVADDADAETKMLNVARHLAGANALLLLLLLLVMLLMLMMI